VPVIFCRSTTGWKPVPPYDRLCVPTSRIERSDVAAGISGLWPTLGLAVADCLADIRSATPWLTGSCFNEADLARTRPWSRMAQSRGPTARRTWGRRRASCT